MKQKKKLLSGHFYYIKVHRGRLVEQLGLWTLITSVILKFNPDLHIIAVLHS